MWRRRQFLQGAMEIRPTQRSAALDYTQHPTVAAVHDAHRQSTCATPGNRSASGAQQQRATAGLPPSLSMRSHQRHPGPHDSSVHSSLREPFMPLSRSHAGSQSLEQSRHPPLRAPRWHYRIETASPGEAILAFVRDSVWMFRKCTREVPHTYPPDTSCAILHTWAERGVVIYRHLMLTLRRDSLTLKHMRRSRHRRHDDFSIERIIIGPVDSA